jgi:hypothetical protein
MRLGTGALAAGKTRVVTGEQLREPFGSFVNVPPGDIQIAEAKCAAGSPTYPVGSTRRAPLR